MSQEEKKKKKEKGVEGWDAWQAPENLRGERSHRHLFLIRNGYFRPLFQRLKETVWTSPSS
jgi:hypothetical protein